MDKLTNDFYNSMDEAVEKLRENQRNQSEEKIITSHDYPPIPLRQYDWSAIRDSYDAGDAIGYGATEQEAIDNLKEQENELL